MVATLSQKSVEGARRILEEVEIGCGQEDKGACALCSGGKGS